MTVDQARRLEALFDRACELSTGARAEFVTRECGADAELRERLLALLAADARPEAPLDRALIDGLGGAAEILAPDRRIGRYRVLRLINEGGMGLVYEAEQENPRRRVALKLLRPGLASPAGLRRFEQEGQLLGRLQHPSIAQIFEAGSAEVTVGAVSVQQPFLAMELIDGAPITRFADEAHLSIAQRLALAADACDAVHYAHQRGIIHRDLKPGNILVSDAATQRPSAAGKQRDEGTAWGDGPHESAAAPRRGPLPKIVDFGIARLTSDDGPPRTEQTAVGQLIGTIPYMSPEQIAGDPAELDVRTDVYSMGVVLYELLCGRLPHTATSTIDLARKICTARPQRPSAVNRALRGDIETIVLKALETDRARRYQSMAQLAHDLRRCLANEPIGARRASAVYVLQKTIARHKLAAALLSAIAATVVVSAVALAVLYRSADAARADAAARAAALRRSSYFNTIALAQAALESRNTRAARRLLDECPPDLRNWEWRWLSAQADNSARTLHAHRGHAGAAFAPDGRRLATWSFDRTARLWDAAAFELLAKMPAEAMLEDGAFSPDGTRLIAAGRDGCVYVWSVPDGRRLTKIAAHDGWTLGAAYAPDGRTFASSSHQRTVKVWDATTFELRWELAGHRSDVQGLVYSPDSSHLYSAGYDDTIRAWDLRTGAAGVVFRGHTDNVRDVAITPDGGRLVSCANDRTVRVWEAATGKLLQVFDCGSENARRVAISPDGRWLAVAAYSAVRMWNLQTFLEAPARLGHIETIGTVDFSPDSAWLITGGGDAVKLWNVDAPGGSTVLNGHADVVRDAAVSPDGRFIATAGEDRRVCVWEADTGALRLRLQHHDAMLRSVCYTPDGQKLISAARDRTVRICDAQTGAQELVLVPPSSVQRIAVSPDGRLLAAGCMSGEIVLYELPGGRVHSILPGAVERVFALAFSPDSRTLAVSDNGRQLRTWDLATSEPVLFPSPETALNALAFSPDGRRLAGAGTDKLVYVWDVARREVLHRLAGHRGLAQSVAFAPDGTRLASGCYGHQVHVWDVESGRLVLTLLGHRGGVPALAFAPDGSFIVSAGHDRTVRLWSAPRADRPAPQRSAASDDPLESTEAYEPPRAEPEPEL